MLNWSRFMATGWPWWCRHDRPATELRLPDRRPGARPWLAAVHRVRGRRHQRQGATDAANTQRCSAQGRSPGGNPCMNAVVLHLPLAPRIRWIKGVSGAAHAVRWVRHDDSSWVWRITCHLASHRLPGNWQWASETDRRCRHCERLVRRAEQRAADSRQRDRTA